MTNYVQQRSDCIKYDTASAADRFGWLEEIRQLDLSLLDAESQMDATLKWSYERKERLEKEGRKQRKILKTWNHSRPDTPNRCYQYELNTICMVVDKYRAISRFIADLELKLGSEIDNKFFAKLKDDPDETVKSVIPAHWQEAKRYWSHILDYISNNELHYNTTKRLYHKVKKAKAKKSISSYFYFHLMFWCTTKLGYLGERRGILAYGAKCKTSGIEGSMWNPLPIPEEDKVYSSSYDDRFYGEMSFDMESAIDIMAQAKTLAARSNISIEESFYSILEEQERELSSTWTPMLLETL